MLKLQFGINKLSDLKIANHYNDFFHLDTRNT